MFRSNLIQPPAHVRDAVIESLDRCVPHCTSGHDHRGIE